MTEIIRLETDEQLKANAALAAEIWREHFRGIITDEQIEYMLDKFQSFEAMKRQLETEHYEYYGFFEDGAQRGYFAIADKGDGTLFLSKLYLHKSVRGRGYASLMFERIKEIARERGLGSVWLTVNRHNDSSVAVYRHWGMEVIREQKADIGEGFVMDDYVFSIDV